MRTKQLSTTGARCVTPYTWAASYYSLSPQCRDSWKRACSWASV